MKINDYMQNREISWLKFNERCLDESNQNNVPLLERLKFISIFTSNLDEFFMIRVGSLDDLTLLKKEYRENKTNMSAKEQINEICKILPKMYKKRDKYFMDTFNLLSKYKIEILKYENLSQNQKIEIDKIYYENISPILSPQIIDFNHPFPFLENKKLYIIAHLKKGKKELFGLIPIQTNYPKYFKLSGERISFLLIEDLILSKTQEIFSDYTIISKNVITITRNFDYSDEYDRYDEFEDYKAYMKEIIKKRKRQNPVRLEIQGNVDEDTLNFLLNKNHLDFERCFYSISPLVTNFLFNIISEIPSAIKNKLLYKDFESSSHIKNTASNMISSVQKNDMLLFYPFDDVDDFINLLKEASEDENCIDIKITIYRLAENSKIVKYLARAAENGKNVTVLMELKARFDEERNIKYSNILYESGCNIIYGFPEYKTHSKVCLLTFIDKNFNNSYITQIGTGNYNESTSRQYTDISFITSNYEIGLDAMDFFKNISIGNLNGKYAHLLQSPYSLKQTFLKLIDEEIKKGKDGFIFAKFNSLTDIDFLKKLQLASENSVEIKLIVRGICCILPKVENKTENIEIHSIVGRFLEHSRVYIFGKGKNSKVFISSADLMTRNMERRVEIACPIYDEILKDKLFNYLNICFKDNIKGRVLCNDGEYRKIKSYDEQISSQDFFIEMAKKYSQNSNLKRDEKLMENDIKKTEKNKFDELKNLSFIEKLKILFFN